MRFYIFPCLYIYFFLFLLFFPRAFYLYIYIRSCIFLLSYIGCTYWELYYYCLNAISTNFAFSRTFLVFFIPRFSRSFVYFTRENTKYLCFKGDLKFKCFGISFFIAIFFSWLLYNKTLLLLKTKQKTYTYIWFVVHYTSQIKLKLVKSARFI